MFLARGQGRWLNDTDLPQMRDIRNATAFLYGYTTCKQRELQVIIGPDRKIAYQSRSRSGLKGLENEVKKVSGQSEHLLTGIEFPEKQMQEIISAYKHGSLGEVEKLAMELARYRPLKKMVITLVNRIKKDRKERFKKIKKLFKENNTAVALQKAKSFIAAYPKTREAHQIKRMKYTALRTKESHKQAMAHRFFEKALESLAKNATTKSEDFATLMEKYPGTYFAKLAKLLWVDNNNLIEHY